VENDKSTKTNGPGIVAKPAAQVLLLYKASERSKNGK